MDAIVHGWRAGKSARALFGVDWANLWATPLADVRARFGLAPADTVSTYAAPARAA
jgi:ubiquinone biosynthesis protein COQ4